MRKPIYLRLTPEEFDKLRDVALNECRDPREHARYLLRIGLGLTEPKNETAASGAINTSTGSQSPQPFAA